MEKTLIVETIECRRRREDQRMRWLYGISDSMDMNVGKFQELVRYREDWLVAVHKVVKNQTQLGDWTAITISYLYICFPGGSLAKNLPASAGDIGLIPELERSPGEGNDSPRQYSCMPNLMDRGAWRATVDVVAKDSDSLATKQQQQWQIPWYVYIFQYIYILDHWLCVHLICQRRDKPFLWKEQHQFTRSSTSLYTSKTHHCQIL